MFIRYGKIPTNEKSVCYFKLSFDEASDLHYFLSSGDTLEDAIEKSVKPGKEVYEVGASCFNCVDNMPVIDNLQQLESLARRINEPVFTFNGDIAGVGTDNEPLVNNISNVSEISVNAPDMVTFIESVLASNYQTIETDKDADKFYVSDACEFLGVFEPHYVKFNGKRYMNPVASWNTKRGYNVYR